MGEAIKVDVAVELAVDALEQVEVEGSGDPAPVVIGGEQDRRTSFFRSTPTRNAASCPSSRAALARKPLASAWVRLPMVEPEKKPSLRGRRATTGSVRVLVKSAMRGLMARPSCRSESHSAASARLLAGDVDRHIEANAGKRAQQQARLAARA